MRIYPVVSNAIMIELKDGTKLEIAESTRSELHIKAVDGCVVVYKLNLGTAGWDEFATEHSITLKVSQDTKRR